MYVDLPAQLGPMTRSIRRRYLSPGRPPVTTQPRLTADTTALRDAVTMLGSRPTPQSTCPFTAHSTYASAWASPPEDSACSDRKSTRLNSSHANISYAVFCLK